MADVPILEFDIFRPHSALIRHGISTRKGGVSPAPYDSLNLAFDTGDLKVNVLHNYEKFCEKVGVEMAKVIFASPQGHTGKSEIIPADTGYTFHSPPCGVDGFITAAAGIPLLVRFADCQGVLMLDPVKKVVAAVHCGWKGNVKNILGKCVQKMVAEMGCRASDILVGISPSLGPESAEFGDPKNELPGEMQDYVNDKKVDLWQCSLDQLVAEGVLAANVENVKRDTMWETEEFFSYRAAGGAEGQTGRMAGVICLI